jgi:hypothetical protein
MKLGDTDREYFLTSWETASFLRGISNSSHHWSENWKGNLSTSLRHQRIKWKAPLFLKHGTRWRREVSFTLRLRFTRDRTPVPIESEAGWAAGPVWTTWRVENLFCLKGFEPPDRLTVAKAPYLHCNMKLWRWMYVTASLDSSSHCVRTSATAESRIEVLWDVTPCRLAYACRRFDNVQCRHLHCTAVQEA